MPMWILSVYEHLRLEMFVQAKIVMFSWWRFEVILLWEIIKYAAVNKWHKMHKVKHLRGSKCILKSQRFLLLLKDNNMLNFNGSFSLRVWSAPPTSRNIKYFPE